jgi:hypothetical protein
LLSNRRCFTGCHSNDRAGQDRVPGSTIPRRSRLEVLHHWVLGGPALGAAARDERHRYHPPKPA